MTLIWVEQEGYAVHPAEAAHATLRAHSWTLWDKSLDGAGSSGEPSVLVGDKFLEFGGRWRLGSSSSEELGVASLSYRPSATPPPAARTVVVSACQSSALQKGFQCERAHDGVFGVPQNYWGVSPGKCTEADPAWLVLSFAHPSSVRGLMIQQGVNVPD